MTDENNVSEIIPPPVEKKKRGRKSKLELEQIKAMKEANGDGTTESVELQVQAQPKIPKKRGRKPKGGKIVEITSIKDNQIVSEPNVILHLKCNFEDLTNSIDNKIETYQFNDGKQTDLNYQYLLKSNAIISSENDENPNAYSGDNNNNMGNNIGNSLASTCGTCVPDNAESNKVIWKKLETLSLNLHNNNIPDKKSSCFWCTCDFDNPPIFIPKYEINKSYYVYGCFCSLECSCAYLINENIDNATKFERYHLLNYIYGKIYNYEKNIKPAPNPYYTLSKYYGNLSIQEYRKLLKSDRLLLVVDKPLSRQLPELHEDNDDYVLSNKSIPSANKFKIKKNQKNQTKVDILQEHFNMH
jgi:hypothetical protein